MRFLALIPFCTVPALAVDFVREVRPIFEKHCYECHGAEKQKNDYRLDIKSVALKHVKPG
ncbi:MAG: c-type cytochrome domain-containing protein, partial [bacterium]